MKLVFLDMDGVLNNAPYLKERQRRFDPAISRAFLAEGQEWSARSIDPACVEQLNRVYESTGARFVLSSTWRTMHTLPVMNRLLHYHGFKSYLVGTTHTLVRKAASETYPHAVVSAGRGREINLWLRTMDFPEPPTFVILDDDSDMEPHMDRLVLTPFETGLTEVEANKAIEMLGGEA